MKLIAFVLRLISPRKGRLGAAAALLTLWPAVALADQMGPVTGLPLPRYASLKTDRVSRSAAGQAGHRADLIGERDGGRAAVSSAASAPRRALRGVISGEQRR